MILSAEKWTKLPPVTRRAVEVAAADVGFAIDALREKLNDVTPYNEIEFDGVD